MIVVKDGNVTNIFNEVDAISWWVGRVQAMRGRNGKQFGVLMQAEESWKNQGGEI